MRVHIGLFTALILGLLAGVFFAAIAIIVVIVTALAMLGIGLRGCYVRYWRRDPIGDAGRRQPRRRDAE